MALVEKYKIGNTTIEIYDDAYKDKSQEDIDRIIKRLEEIASRSLYKQIKRELDYLDDGKEESKCLI